MLFYKTLCLCALAFGLTLAAPVPDFDLDSVTAVHNTDAAKMVLTVAEYVDGTDSK
jgi:hypothetical protein